MKDRHFFLHLLLLIALSTITYGSWVRNYGLHSNHSSYVNLDLNKDFTLIYGGAGFSVKGDFVATGNTIMDGNKNATYFADSNPHILSQDAAVSALGTSSRNRNSSSAPLSLPSYVHANDIVWAGLFWQGQVHEKNIYTLSAVDNRVSGWNTVHIKTPDGQIHTVTAPIGNNTNAHSTYHYAHYKDNEYRYFYSAYAEVTDIIKNGQGSQEYLKGGRNPGTQQ